MTAESPPQPPPPPPQLPPPQPPPFDTEYVVPSGVGWQAAGALALGGLLAVMILVRFALLLAADAAAPSRGGGMESGWVGGLGAGAFFLLAYGFSLLRRPVRARLNDHEIVVEGFVSRRAVPWKKVAQLRRDKKTESLGQETVDVLVLLDEKGKPLAKLAGGFLNFAALVADVEARSAAARGAPTYDRGADLARKTAARRRSRWKTAALAGVLTAFGVAAVSWGAYDWRKDRAIQRDGVEVQAKLDRHYMVRVTGRIEFSFTDPATGRRVSRETSLEPDDWRALAGRKTVQVRYVPSNPDWNRVAGESAREGSPLLMVVLGSGLTLLFATMLLFTALGYSDITVKDGKLRVKRYDDVDDALEPGATMPRLPAYLTHLPVSPAPPVSVAPAAPPAWPQPYLYPGGYSAPLPYAPPPPHPAGIHVVAVLNLVFGLIGVLLNGLRALMVYWKAGQVIRVGSAAIVVQDNPLVIAGLVGDCLLAAALAVSAIGLFRLKAWGRRLALAAAGLQLLSSAVVLALEIRDAAALSELTGADYRHAVAQLAGRLTGVVIGAVYPAIVLVVLGRKTAGTAFQGSDATR